MDRLKEQAKSLKMSPAQLALAWIRAHSNRGDCGVVIPIPGATKVGKVEDNCEYHELSAAEKSKIDELLQTLGVAGKRSAPGAENFLLT